MWRLDSIGRTALTAMAALCAGTSAWASDACSDRGIVASADVTVSDGSSFSTEAFYRAPDIAAIRHARSPEQTVAVEGPVAWAQVGDEAELGTNFHKAFALGHQYHAFVIDFDSLVTGVRGTAAQPFRDRTYTARSGDYPFGGTVHWIDGDSPERPLGLVFEFPETAPIEVAFSDWRQTDGAELPFRVDIDDGDRVFNYRYTKVEHGPRSPLWYAEAVPAPSIDEVRVYRLHRQLLAAHCLGDAEMMADLSVEEVVSANRGRLDTATRDSIRERFARVFEQVDYTEYHDISQPEVRVASAGDMGWIGVNVRAVGSYPETGASFDDQWAWLMIVRKVNGRWLHAANASNVAADTE